MSFSARLLVFATIAIAGVVAWQWNVAADASREVTELALHQFQNDADVPAKLQQAGQTQNWWPFVLPALLAGVGIVMFWEDIERLWKPD